LWERSMTAPQLDEWRRTGWLSVFHYAQKVIRPVHYGLFEESALHPPEPRFTQPGRIFHGLHDRVVPIRISRDFARHNPQCQLTELDSDHDLVDVLDQITSAAIPFLLD
jgi:pimeloyl-ACP methyl ester carboxylesterase